MIFCIFSLDESYNFSIAYLFLICFPLNMIFLQHKIRFLCISKHIKCLFKYYVTNINIQLTTGVMLYYGKTITLKFKRKDFGGIMKSSRVLGFQNNVKQTKFTKQNLLSPFHFIHVKCNPGFSRAWSTLVLACYNSKSDDTQRK